MHIDTTSLPRRAATQAPPSLEACFLNGLSPSMVPIVRALENLAQSDAPVLIVGETGTGKRAIAAEIHRLSPRSQQNFVALNGTDLNSHFESCHDASLLSGTLFLNEIAEISAADQLWAFQTLFGVNQAEESALRPRLIASSQRNLAEEVRGGRFREDLYYRIGGICICVPPLRQRKEDIPSLAQHFATKHSTLLGHALELSSRMLELFVGYPWPGNVRELEHTVQTIVAIGDETIALAAMRASGFNGISQHAGIEPLSLKQAGRAASRQAERELILNTLSRTRWNRKRAALDLQISYKALLYKMKQVGIQEDDPTASGAKE